MNKLIFATLLTGGLLLANSPDAAAHSEVRNVHFVPTGHHVVVHRAEHMPRWLKRNKSFRRWYRQTPPQWRRHLGWHELYDVFLWERAGPRHHRYYDDRRHDYRDRDGHRRRH